MGRTLEGTVHPDFKPLVDVLSRAVKRHTGGAAICVYHHGRPVVDLWGGVRNRAGDPWLRDTMSPSFSTTKGAAATTLHTLVDRGLLDYDDPVAEHWPAFAQAGKQHITVRQVLAHQSGLYHIRQMIESAEQMLDWDYVIRALERARPIHEPGTRTGYHGLTFGFLVGEIIQRVTGKPFPEVVQQNVVRPLGLDGMHIGAPDHVLHRAAELISPPARTRAWISLIESGSTAARALLSFVRSGGSTVRRLTDLEVDMTSILDALAPRGISSFDFSAHRTLRVPIPAANGLFTARSLARMYAALAAGGTLDGVELLSRRTLARATTLQSPTQRHHVIPFDMRWRLGYHGVATTHGFPRAAFGHFGFGGSGAWADPQHSLAVAFITNSGIGTPFGDLRILRVSGTALSCARRRARKKPHFFWAAPVSGRS